jgi:hypothetical protein
VNHLNASLESVPASRSRWIDTPVAVPVRRAFGAGRLPPSLFSNWKFFQRADNIEHVQTLSRGKIILN